MKFFTKVSSTGDIATVMELSFHELTFLRGRFVGQYALMLGGGIFSSWVTKKEYRHLKKKFPADYLPLGWEYFKPDAGLITVVTEVRNQLTEEDYQVLLEVEMANLHRGKMAAAAADPEPCGTYSHGGVSFFLSEEILISSDTEVGNLRGHALLKKARLAGMTAEAVVRNALDSQSGSAVELLTSIRNKRISERRWQALEARVVVEKQEFGIHSRLCNKSMICEE